MRFEEFKTIALTLRAVFPTMKPFDSDEGVKIWYEMLKDLEYKVAAEAAAIYIRESPYPPTVADIRRISRKIIVPDWSVEWQKLLQGAVYSDLNAPAQYALKTLTEDYVNDMVDRMEKSIYCMKEFERLYGNYFKLTVKDKEVLQELGVWEQEPDAAIGFIPMKKRAQLASGGRIIE